MVVHWQYQRQTTFNYRFKLTDTHWIRLQLQSKRCEAQSTLPKRKTKALRCLQTDCLCVLAEVFRSEWTIRTTIFCLFDSVPFAVRCGKRNAFEMDSIAVAVVSEIGMKTSVSTINATINKNTTDSTGFQSKMIACASVSGAVNPVVYARRPIDHTEQSVTSHTQWHGTE